MSEKKFPVETVVLRDDMIDSFRLQFSWDESIMLWKICLKIPNCNLSFTVAVTEAELAKLSPLIKYKEKNPNALRILDQVSMLLKEQFLEFIKKASQETITEVMLADHFTAEERRDNRILYSVTRALAQYFVVNEGILGTSEPPKGS